MSHEERRAAFEDGYGANGARPAQLLPSRHAAAMWSLHLVAFPVPGSPRKNYYLTTIEGPDRTIKVSYEVTHDDAPHMPDSSVHVGERTDRFWSVDAATTAGMAVFNLIAGQDDILVAGGSVDEEWPLVGPKEVLEEANALRERRLISTWLQILSRYRQFAPTGRRGTQYVAVRQGDGGCDVTILTERAI